MTAALRTGLGYGWYFRLTANQEKAMEAALGRPVRNRHWRDAEKLLRFVGRHDLAKQVGDAAMVAGDQYWGQPALFGTDARMALAALAARRVG